MYLIYVVYSFGLMCISRVVLYDLQSSTCSFLCERCYSLVNAKHSMMHCVDVSP